MTKTNDTIIARRATADGKHVCLWSDGSLTWALGYAIKGSANPRTPAQREQALRAGWLVLGEVELYDAEEVSVLVRAARAVAKRGGEPGDLRALLAAQSAPRMPGGWTVLATDRDGNPIERAWRFPRLSSFADMAIWHVRGRYHVLSRMLGSSDTFAPTGYVCETLGEAFCAIRSTVCEAAQ